jgi:hypothetical protein
MSGKIERNKKAKETRRKNRKEKIKKLKNQMEMDIEEDWDNQFSELMRQYSGEASAPAIISASASGPEPRMKMASASVFDPEPRMKMASASAFDPEPEMKMASASAFDPEPGMKLAADNPFVDNSRRRAEQNRIAARERGDAIRFLGKQGPRGADNSNSNSNSNSNVLQSALRPVKDVTKELLQMPIHPVSFRARLRYVQEKIIPLNLPVCVPTTFFVMSGRINTTQLGDLIEYPKFKCNGMLPVEIGKLFESYGYRHSNEEYKTSDVIYEDVVTYSGRYYNESQIELFVKQIKSTLKLNHVTPVGFNRRGSIGHAACIANLTGRVFLVDVNIDEMIPIDNLSEYIRFGGATRPGVYTKFDNVQIYYGASEEEPDIELPPKREASGRVVGIGPAMSSNKEEGPVRIRKLKDGEENPRKRSRTEGGRNYTRRRR